MAEIKGVGVLLMGNWRSHRELLRWQRRRGTLDLRFEVFADLDDGRRIVTDERHGSWGMTLGATAVALPVGYDGPPINPDDFRPGAADLEGMVRGDWEALPDDARWSGLIAALGESGIRAS